MFEQLLAALNTPSSVDWCEPNYIVTPLVAEFWNTTTSIPLLLSGLGGAYLHGRHREESRFTLGFMVVALTGIGSMAFHGSLVRGAQALDELPMIFTGLLAVWMLLCRDRPVGEGRLLGGALATVAAVFTGSYFYFPSYFEVFLATYGCCVAFMVIRSFQLSLRADAPPLSLKLVALSTISYVGGLLLFWMPEHVLLSCDHPAQALQLHGWWHITSMIGTYAWFYWIIVDRDAALQALSSPDSTDTINV